MAPSPKPYQHDGIDFLAAANDNAILGDDAGLGKSLQLIRAADKIGAERVMVGCPAVGRVSWRLQFAEWQTIPRPVHFYPTNDNLPAKGPAAVVVSYDWLSHARNRARLVADLGRVDPFDALFLDEVQYLKTPSASRTKAVYGGRLDRKGGIASFARHVWPASATLTPNNAAELYPHIKALFPQVLVKLFGYEATFVEFRDRFCHVDYTPFGAQIRGNNREQIPALRDALRPYLLVRKKADVLGELDPILSVLLPLEVQDEQPLFSAQADAQMQQIMDAAEALGLDPLDALRAASPDENADKHIATRRRELGMAKVEPATVWVRDFLSGDPDRKLVIFAYHRDVIERLAVDLMEFRPAVLYGGMTPRQKEQAVARFQGESNCRVFIGQTHAAGTSITLTAASDVLLLEPDWTPINNYQCISRCHRIGQKSSVTAWFAHADGTVDTRISKVLRRKADDAAQLTGEIGGGVVDQNLSTPP